MILYSHTLTDTEMLAFAEFIQCLNKIDNETKALDVKRGGGSLLKETRLAIQRYANEKNIGSNIEKREISDLLNLNSWRIKDGKCSRRHTISVAFIADFFLLRFESMVLNSIELHKSQIKEIDSSLNCLKKSIYQRLSKLNNPFSLLASEIPYREATQTVPDEFLGDFIGYRRSATNNHVIRFRFRIFRQGLNASSYVRYENSYIRGIDKIIVKGGGVYSDDTLHLFGHAKRKNGSSAGYRVQALQTIRPGCPILIGPVISKVARNPIAARIILLPLSEHDWTADQISLSKDERIKQIIQPQDHRDYGEYVNEIASNTRRYLKENECRNVFYHISNFTSSLIIGRPGNNNPMMKIDMEVRRLLFLDYLNSVDSGEKLDTIRYEETLRSLIETYLSSRKSGIS